MNKIEKQILKNQEVILLALSKLIIPLCNKGLLSKPEEKVYNELIDNYYKTQSILNDKN